jgi:hypothetical protein
MDIKCWQDFVPPSGFYKHIRRALHWIEPEDLAGIDHVLLLEDVPLVSLQADANLERDVKDGLLLFGAYSLDLRTYHHTSY